MRYKFTVPYLFGAALIFTACTSVEEDVKKSGATPMTASEISALYLDKTVNGVSEKGIKWVVYYDPSGEIRGKATWSGGSENDSGVWRATADDMLCMQFKKWRQGKLRCWQLYMVDGKLTYVGKKGGAESGPDDDTWRDGNAENL